MRLTSDCLVTRILPFDVSQGVFQWPTLSTDTVFKGRVINYALIYFDVDTLAKIGDLM